MGSESNRGNAIVIAMKDQQPGGPLTKPRLGDHGAQVAPLDAES